MNAISARKKETIENTEEIWDIKEKLPSSPEHKVSQKLDIETGKEHACGYS